jgi:hypothetical protein
MFSRCAFGMSINDVNYEMPIDDLDTDNPRQTKITRSENGTSDMGIIYEEGVKDPFVITAQINDVPNAVLDRMKQAQASKERVKFYLIDKVDGSSIIYSNSIIQSEPYQKSINNTAESANIELIFSTFKREEKRK